MSNFVKEVAGYFQNFLETDFRKRRLPKRSIQTSNKDGIKILVNLDKYKKFKKQLTSDIKESNKFDFNFLVKPNSYITTVPEISNDFIVKSVLTNLENRSVDVREAFESKLLGSFLEHIEDIEKFFESCDNLVQEVLGDMIFQNSTRAITETLQRLNDGDTSGNFEIEYELGAILFDKEKDVFHKALMDFSVKQDVLVFDTFFSRLLSANLIEKVINDYFNSFAINDLFQDLATLEKEIRSNDNLEGYIYIGEVIFNKKSFPIAFIPIEIDANISGQISLSFEKRYYVNKQAIEYAYQEVTGSNAAGIAGIVKDRTVVLEEEDTLYSHIHDAIISIVGRGFQIADTFPQGLELPATIGNDKVKFKNSILLTVSDKGDESALNDYEEILSMVDGKDGLFSELQKLFGSFIEENPISIATKIREGWEDTSTEDRLVFESPIPVNEEQRKIISAVNSNDARFITVHGPPGTGKSHTITAILFKAILENKSVLLLSDKKEALDVVEDKLTETLNKVRPDENFQNPILRIGKTGNTYAKILSAQNAENIRVSYEATKDALSKKKDNLKNEIESLKTGINENILAYEKVKLSEIAEIHALQEKLSINDEHLNLLASRASKVNTLTSSINLIIEIKNSLSDDEKHLFDVAQAASLSNDSEIMVDVANIFISKEHQAIKEYFNSYDIDDLFKVKTAIKEYGLKKTGFWGSIFGNLMLGDWQKELVMLLDLKSSIDFRKNIDVLENYLSLLNKLLKIDDQRKPEFLSTINKLDFSANLNKKSFIDLDAAKAKLLKAQHDLLTEEMLHLLIQEEINPLNLTLNTEVEKLNEINNLVQAFNGIQKIFAEIKDIRYLDNSKDIYQDTAIEMTQRFDKRFLEFYENQRSDANTFKRVITKKQRFPKDDFHKLKNAFPCIIAGIRDYAEYIPLDREVFDLLIIDEASQVSIAQAFPALIRAKKVLVLGDNKQFSNVKSTTASNAINQTYLNNIRSQARKDFGDDPTKLERAKVFDVRTSILDFFSFTTNYDALLKKHFRGYPELISFSSKYFYQGQLQALKVRAKPIEDVIEFRELEHDGLVELKGNINSIEANEIIKILEEKILQENPQSVGVITPFRDQQKLILNAVYKSPKSDEIFKKLRFKVMTFDSCQGEERDHIIYSFVENKVSKARTSFVLGSKFEDDMDPEQNLRLQRLNVGMSRSKEKITFLLSQKVEEFSGNALLILNHYQKELELGKQLPKKEQTDSPMEKKLLNWIEQSQFYQLNKENLEIQSQFKVGEYIKALDPSYKHPSYRCDFLITHRTNDNSKIAIIEYDGFEYHFANREDVHEFNYENYYTERDVEREKILESYGFPFIRFNRFNLGKDPVETVSKRLQGFFLPSP